MADDGIERRKAALEKNLREFEEVPRKSRDGPSRFIRERDHERQRPRASQPYFWETSEQRDQDRLLVPRRPRVLGTSNSDTPIVYRDRDVTERPDNLRSESRRPASLPPEDRMPKPVEPLKKQGKPNDKPRQQFSAHSLPLEVETVYNSSHTKDVTVHLEFDLASDIDEELEEFNRLTRLGDYHNAKLFFHDRLKEHASDPFVFVQYAEMLLDQGDFKSVLQLDASEAFHLLRAPNNQDSNSTLEKLNWNWRLIRATALSFGQFELQPVWSELEKLMDVPPDNPGSTEIRILSLSLRLRKLAPYPTEGNHSSVDWSKTYQHLLAQDRIWDFKDLFIAYCTVSSTVEAANAFFKSDNPLEIMVADWQTPEPDESTELALLEIFSFMALSSTTSSEIPPFAERCLEAADAIGDSLLRHFPLAINSRPVLQWLITKAAISARKGPRSPLAFDYLSDYPGQAVLPKRLGIPYYIPVRQENPGWFAPELPIASTQSVELALEGARQLKDYHTQAICLKELIVRSADPTMLFDKLGHLQRSIQGNMDGYLTTCLSRYLICKDDDLKARLLTDLAEFGAWDDPRDLISPAKAATRDIMRRALSRAPQIGFVPNSIKAGVRYYNELPAFFQRMIDDHVPLKNSTAEIRRRSTSPPPRPQKIIIREERPVRQRSSSRHRPVPTGVVVEEGPNPATNDRFGRVIGANPEASHAENPAKVTPRVFEPRDTTEATAGRVAVFLPNGEGRPENNLESNEAVNPEYEYYVERDDGNVFEDHRAPEYRYYSDDEPERSRTPSRERGTKLATAAIDVLAEKAKARLKKWEEDMDRRDSSPSPSETRGRTRTRSGSESRHSSRDRVVYSRSNSRSMKKKSGLSKFVALAAAAAGAAAAAKMYSDSKGRRRRGSDADRDYRDYSRSRSRSRSRDRAKERSIERDRYGRHHAHVGHRGKNGHRNSDAQKSSEKTLDRKVPPPLPPRMFSAPTQAIVEEIETDQESRPTSGQANEGRDPHLMFAAASPQIRGERTPEVPLGTKTSHENNDKTEESLIESIQDDKPDEAEDPLAKTGAQSSEFVEKAE